MYFWNVWKLAPFVSVTKTFSGGKQAAVGHHITQRLADTQLFLGNKSVAVELLLASSTNSDNHHHVQDALTACVIAATIDQDTFQNTVKMVATNLMAHEKIDAGFYPRNTYKNIVLTPHVGVRLLCSIGRGFDACRYLQEYADRWTEAAWIAKVHKNALLNCCFGPFPI